MKHIRTLIFILLVLGLGLYWWPQKVDRTYQGWLTNYESTVNESVEIRLQGTMHRSLIAPHRIDGKVTIGEITLPTIRSYPGSLKVVWSFFKDRWQGKGMDIGLGNVGDDNILKIQGHIRVANNLSEIAGYLYEVKSSPSIAHLTFAAPATNSNQVWGISHDLIWGRSVIWAGKTPAEAILSRAREGTRILYEQRFMEGKLVLYTPDNVDIIASYVSQSGSRWVAEGSARFASVAQVSEPLTCQYSSWGRTRRSGNDDFIDMYLGAINDPDIATVQVETSQLNSASEATQFYMGEQRFYFILLTPGEAPSDVQVTGLSAEGRHIYKVK